jgi:hypothetical protein
MATDPTRDDRREDEGREEEGLTDGSSPLPPPGGETSVPAEGPDDPPNAGEVPSDPDDR